MEANTGTTTCRMQVQSAFPKHVRVSNSTRGCILNFPPLKCISFQYQFFLKHKLKNNWGNKQDEGNLTEE